MNILGHHPGSPVVLDFADFLGNHPAFIAAGLLAMIATFRRFFPVPGPMGTNSDKTTAAI